MPALSACRRNERIEISRLNAPTFAGDLIRAVYDGRQRGYEFFKIAFFDQLVVFPNAAVPLAALLEFYRAKFDINFKFENATEYLLSNVLYAQPVSEVPTLVRRQSLNQVWKFADSKDIGLLTDAIVHFVAGAAACRRGVLNALAWCLYEVFDNVLLHAAGSPGYMMSQIHGLSNRIAICIFDCGPGVFNTLKNSHHAPETPAGSPACRATRCDVRKGNGQRTLGTSRHCCKQFRAAYANVGLWLLRTRGWRA